MGSHPTQTATRSFSLSKKLDRVTKTNLPENEDIRLAYVLNSIEIDMPKSPYLRRHRPLIASRIEFILMGSEDPMSPLPPIRSRIEFTPKRLGAETEARAGVTQLPIRLATTEAPASLQDPTASPTKIPKPPGEPGRPKSGGYCLLKILVETHNWSEQSVADLSVRICP